MKKWIKLPGGTVWHRVGQFPGECACGFKFDPEDEFVQQNNQPLKFSRCELCKYGRKR